MWRKRASAILEYFAAHGYERLERYLGVDPFNWYFAPAEMPR